MAIAHEGFTGAPYGPPYDGTSILKMLARDSATEVCCYDDTNPAVMLFVTPEGLQDDPAIRVVALCETSLGSKALQASEVLPLYDLSDGTSPASGQFIAVMGHDEMPEYQTYLDLMLGAYSRQNEVVAARPAKQGKLFRRKAR
jgi:hypothetical protein